MSIMIRILGKKSSSFSVCFVWRNVNLLWDLYLPCFQFSGYVINFAVLLLMLSWAGWLQLPNQIQATRQNILRGGTQLCESRADLRGNCADMRQNRRARRQTETWELETGLTHYCHPESVMSGEWSVVLFQYISEFGVGKTQKYSVN